MIDLIDVERAILKKYRAKLYRPFIKALQEYELIKEGDCVGVCMSGGKDSFVMAKLFQVLKRHSDINFDIKFLVMNPGFNEENLNRLISNSKALDIPIIIKESNVFSVAQKMDPEHPCYLCARMRRGFLYQFAKEQGCNKIALAHHFNDVIETTLLNVLYSGNYKTMVPKLKSTNFKGMELIRPMVLIHEKDIKNYMEYIEIQPMNCGCKVASSITPSKRQTVKQWIELMKRDFKDVETSIYRSAENVNLNCLLGWKHKDSKYTFLDDYDIDDGIEDD